MMTRAEIEGLATLAATTDTNVGWYRPDEDLQDLATNDEAFICAATPYRVRWLCRLALGLESLPEGHEGGRDGNG